MLLGNGPRRSENLLVDKNAVIYGREKVMDPLMDALFDLIPQMRYVAVYRHGELSLRQRLDLSPASAPESYSYEEFLVNPTVLTQTDEHHASVR